MSARVIAERYARAFAETVADDGALARAHTELEELSAVLAEHDGLRRALVGYTVPAAAREAVLEELLERFEDENGARRLVRTLYARKRLDRLSDVVAALGQVLGARLNQIYAEVVVAEEMLSDQKERLRARLAEHYGKSVSIETQVDPDILGGVVVKTEGLVIDGSLRSQLERIRTALLTQENE